MAREGDTETAGVHSDSPVGIDDRHLASRGAGIGVEQASKRVLGTHALGEQVERFRPVRDLHVCLRGDYPDPWARPGH